MKRKRIIAVFEMALCGLLWSIAGLFIKQIQCNAMVIAGFRSLFAGLTFVVIMMFSRIPFICSRRVFRGACCVTGTFLAFVFANKLTTAANVVVLHYTAPVFILLVQYFFMHLKPTRIDVLSVLFTFAGILLFFVDKVSLGGQLGNVLALISGFFMGMTFLCLGDTTFAERLNCVLLGHVFTAVIGIPFVFGSGNSFTPHSWLCLVILGVVQLGLPFYIYGRAADDCPSLLCSLLSSLEVIMNPVWVAIFMGEIPGPFAFVGGAVVLLSLIGGVLMRATPSRREERRTGASPEL